MGTNFIEIPVERVEARIPGRISPINLKPEYIYPIVPSTTYADNEPYLTTTTLAILFKVRQENSSLLNPRDWIPLNDAMKKGNLSLTLITPPEFDDVVLQAIEMGHNSYTEMVEINGTIKKEN